MALHVFHFDKMKIKLNYRRQNLYFLHRNVVQGSEITTWYKKDHNPNNHYDVITHLEPDILEYEIKWAFGNITTNKASGGDGIPVELFQILKDDAVKVLHSICSKFGKLSSGQKGQFSFQSQRKAMPKNAQATAQLHSFHMLVWRRQ